MNDLRVNSRYALRPEEIHWSFARSSGPGGQNVNKVNSKAVLRWTPTPGSIPPSVWARIREQGKRYLTADGSLVIQCQVHRDQEQNKAECLDRLIALLRTAFVPPKRRLATRPTGASRRRRLDEKRRHSQKKRIRRQRNFDD
ncbi:MAG: aminoacyl-tRNA hydrolase [Planctomycetota bacterium]|nr:MAG: aminoacyl-tRNA hydrolase [Planctomycetota bacterium]